MELFSAANCGITCRLEGRFTRVRALEAFLGNYLNRSSVKVKRHFPNPIYRRMIEGCPTLLICFQSRMITNVLSCVVANGDMGYVRVIHRNV
jgi:hypothetical protein